MGILTDLFERRVSPANPDAWYIRMLRGNATSAGVEVDLNTALSSTAIFAGVRLLSEALATVPLNVYRADNGRREVARNHPLQTVIHTSWNPELTAAEGRTILLANAIACGNGYAEIVRDGAGRVRELWPIWPNRITPKHDAAGELVYVVRPPGGATVTLTPDRVLHLRGFSLGGLVGLDVVATMADAVALTVATERFGSSYFGRGATPSGVLEYPGALSDVAMKNLEESWEGGLGEAHRVRVLEEGMKFTPISIPPEAAQFLQTRKFQISEVARMLNVPPHLLRELDRATYSNIEQQGIEFVRYSLRPWAVLLEQRLQRLLSDAEQSTFYTRHVLDGLLRGDTKSRFEAYAIARNWGWYSANDVLELEDRNGIGDVGDMYLVPGNMIPADAAGALMTPPAPPEPDGTRALLPPFEESMARAVRAVEAHGAEERRAKAEARTIARRVRYREQMEPRYKRLAAELVAEETEFLAGAIQRETRDADSFLVAVRAYYRDFPKRARTQFADAFAALAELLAASVADETGAEVGADAIAAFVNAYAETFGRRWAVRATEQITALVEGTPPDELAAVLDAKVATWRDTKAGSVAGEEKTRSESAFVRAAYMVVGVLLLKWVNNAGACPLCRKLNQRTVGIETTFVGKGETLTPDDDETAPLKSNQNVSHPPLHRGCNCSIVAGG